MHTIIVNGNIITGDGKTILEDHSLVIDGELIDGISHVSCPVYTSAGWVVDAGGGFVIPGIINDHTHCITMGPYCCVYAMPSLPKSRVAQNLNRHLLQGTTTVVSVDGFTTMEELVEARQLTPALVQLMSLHLPLHVENAALLDLGGLREEHKRTTVEDMSGQGAVGIGEVGALGIRKASAAESAPDISYYESLYIPLLVRQKSGVEISTEESRALRTALFPHPPNEKALSDLVAKLGISAAMESLKEVAERRAQHGKLALEAHREAAVVAGKLGVPISFHSGPQTKSETLEFARDLGNLFIATHINYLYKPQEAIEVARAVKKAGGWTDILSGDFFGVRRFSPNHATTLALLAEGLVDMICTDYMGGYWDPIPRIIEYAVDQKVVELPQAIAMVTGNVLKAIPNVAPNRGQISEGKIADLVILSRENISRVRTVIIGGEVVVDEGRIVWSPNN